MFNDDPHHNAEKALWQAVLLLAVEDALLGVDSSTTPAGTGTSAAKHRDMRITATKRARAYLTKANDGLATVCHLAGLDPQAVMEHMRKRIANAPSPEELASNHKVRITQAMPRPKPAPKQQRRPTHYTLDGTTLPVKEWAARIGASPQVIYGRLYMSGWPLREALTTPAMGKRRASNSDFNRTWQRGSPAIKLTLDGETLTIAEWAERTGLKIGTIKQRRAKGWPVERILDTSDQRRKSEEQPA